MTEITRAQIARIGVDIAKAVMHVHAVDSAGRRVLARALKREQFLAWCAGLPAGCVVAMESCSGAHHWGRQLMALGLQVRLIAPHLVTPYRMEGKGGKNDMTDAAAICEAASRPQMRFVPVKSARQQGLMALHTVREGFKEERTACINRIRGVLVEAGLAFPIGPKALRAKLPDALEDASNELSGTARMTLQVALEHWNQLDEHMRWCDRQIGEHVRTCQAAQRAAAISGIGAITASAVTAIVGDFSQFKSSSQFGSWLGLVPRQNSSGGKPSLGRITKRGNEYLRTLLIQGAKSAVLSAHKRVDPISKWIQQLLARMGWQKACVALANKNARILWAMMTRDHAYDASHVPVKPSAKLKQPPQPQPQPQPEAAPA